MHLRGEKGRGEKERGDASMHSLIGLRDGPLFSPPSLTTLHNFVTNPLHSLQLERLQNDDDAGEFDLFSAKKAIERSRVEGIAKAEFQRVLFLDLLGQNGLGGDGGALEVPSLTCDCLSPTDFEVIENVSPGSLVAAEARVGDFVLLPKLNKNKTRGMGSGMGVDSMVLLQSRAEKQFLGKAVHKAVVKGEKKSAEFKWSKVLEVSRRELL